MDKSTRKEPIRLSELNFTPILIAVAVIIVTLRKKFFSALDYLIKIYSHCSDRIPHQEEKDKTYRCSFSRALRLWQNALVFTYSKWQRS